MAVTWECGDTGSRIVDTAAATGAKFGPSFVSSQAVAEYLPGVRYVIADTVTQTVNFGTVAAAKVFEMVSDQTVTLKLNAEATGHACKFFRIVDSAGGITSATIANASGSTATVDLLIAGAT